jgi:hypothetical protein
MTSTSWPVTQLQKSFALLVRRSSGLFNIGLFIDGLDEHDRDLIRGTHDYCYS